MPKEFWTFTKVVELFEVEERFLVELEEEEILCPIRRKDPPVKLFTSSELEKLRLVKILVEDMGVNLAGVDIVLRMRQDMIKMRKQFDAILEDLARQVKETFKKGS